MIIVVPLDFSENSIKALDFAHSMAAKKNGKIILVHVFDDTVDFPFQDSDAPETRFRDSEDFLKKCISRYENPSVEIDYEIVEGNKDINISRIADDRQATLIVMGTQGSSGITKTLFGSTSVNVIQKAGCPVLLVPAQAAILSIKKVTLAMEFADHEDKFIEWIVGMSGRWELALEILHVHTSHDFDGELVISQMERFFEERYPELRVRIHTFYANSASEGLEFYLEENDNMILVMGHQHKNLWDQILQKSLSFRMAYHTDIPLLIMN